MYTCRACDCCNVEVVFFYSYRYEDRSNIGPSSMPVCRSYDDAVAQLQRTGGRRQQWLKEGEEAMQSGAVPPADNESDTEEQKNELVRLSKKTSAKCVK